jgi:hypothetical protein
MERRCGVDEAAEAWVKEISEKAEWKIVLHSVRGTKSQFQLHNFYLRCLSRYIVLSKNSPQKMLLKILCTIHIPINVTSYVHG